MNENFARQAQEFFGVAKDVRIPDNVQAFAEESVAKTREAYQKLNTAAKDGARAIEEVVLTAQAGAKALGDKVINNFSANTEALFDAAQAMARARTLPEAARLQADFMQQQLAIANAQTKELLELSAKIAKQTFETMNAAGTKTIEQLRKTA
jgi:phasin